MQCPRLTHFVRFNPNGTISRCGHMVNAPQFNNLPEMNNSSWLLGIRAHLEYGNWPMECVRCQETETVNNTSIRLNSIEFDQRQTVDDYLVVGGVLDNICNSGCLTCNEMLSTKIGSLSGKSYPIVDNSNKFWQLPTDKIVHLDINGGEPSASKNYKHLLKNLPPNVKSVRINTNCSLIIHEIENLIANGIAVTITVSLDGIENVHDYVRWPIKWNSFLTNLMYYKSIVGIKLNTWTTVSALNIHDLLKIKQFTANNQIEHSYAFLSEPDVLSIKYQNSYTLPFKQLFPHLVAVDRNNQTEIDQYILQQNNLRGLHEDSNNRA